MRLSLILPLMLPLSACSADETLRAYGAADKVWHLSELSGAAFTGQTTITFPEPGQIAGSAPCNRYVATQDAPYPWFKAGPIGATRRSCPDLTAETAYFAALAAATLSEVLGDTLILSDEDGPLLVFKARD